MSLFSRAFELDPDYAAAYGMAARSYGQRKGFGWTVDAEEEREAALHLARKAARFGRDDAIALAGGRLCAGDVRRGRRR